MDETPEKSSRLKRILYFFPIQLLLLHIKRNHLILVFWVVLFGYVTSLFGQKYGIPYLFLTPEYQGEVNFISYGILGFAPVLFMAFNIYSYIMHGHKFRFIATVGRPFYKFSLNNAALPWIYVIVYITASVHSQHIYQLIPVFDIVINIVSFMIGILGFIVLSFLYFFRTNKDIVTYKGEPKEQPVHSKLHNKKKWYEAFLHDQEWNVTSYMVHPFKVGIARDTEHYDKSLIRSIFSQNRINASYFELIMIASFFILGTFKETDWVMIPAGASIILLFTILIMFISILFSWFKGWTVTVVAAAILLFHWVSSENDILNYRSYAYGLNYDDAPTEYTYDNVRIFAQNKSLYVSDSLSGVHILHNWKKRMGTEKPPLIIITTSGGGSRSSLWTFRVLQYLDEQTNGAFFKHSQLITGSSGGMIGAAYYRELFLRDLRKQDSARFDKEHLDKISNDMLNSIAVTIATTDLLFRFQHFDDGDRSYTKDRGYMFEKTLNRNTDYVMNKRLKDYKQPEASGSIPMMILAPTIINDGKRLMISPQPISYMAFNAARTPESETHIENIEFQRLFADQDAMNLKFTSALRMNATFPYVTPMITLPCEPSIEIMDAGLRDNYGVKDAVKYISTFEKWIMNNTSRVIIVQIRDNKKDFNIEHRSSGSLLNRVLTPFSNVYGNILKTQDYNDDQLLDQLVRRFHHPIEFVHFDLMFSTEDRISLSWHLTTLEKKRAINSITLDGNRQSVERIKKMLNNQ